MKNNLPTLAAFAAASLLLLAPGAAKAKPARITQDSLQFITTGYGPEPSQVSFGARVEELLRQSGYQYRKVKENSWYFIVPGREMAQIRIILGAGPSSIAMGAVVVPKKDLRLSADALYKLMRLSYDLNYVRVCIDPDDDLLVMSQRKETWLNLDEFKSTIIQVSTAADRAYAVMRPFLTP